MKGNILKHAGIEAAITFDSSEMKLVGTIKGSREVDVFSAYSVDDLDDKYKRAAVFAKQREEIRQELTNQLFSLSMAVGSGKARVRLDNALSDQRIGMTVKALLDMADGAGFIIHEQLND